MTNDKAGGGAADIAQRLDPVYEALKDNDCTGAALALEAVLKWCRDAAPASPAQREVDSADTTGDAS